VVVVSHEHIGGDIQFEKLDHLSQGVQKHASVAIIDKDVPPFVSPGKNMVKGSRILNAPGA
jgi:hypothetical protein